MEVNFYPRDFRCFNAMLEESIERDVRALIAPVKVKKLEDELKIFWACNYGEKCKNGFCVYA